MDLDAAGVERIVGRPAFVLFPANQKIDESPMVAVDIANGGKQEFGVAPARHVLGVRPHAEFVATDPDRFVAHFRYLSHIGETATGGVLQPLWPCISVLKLLRPAHAPVRATRSGTSISIRSRPYATSKDHPARRR